MLEEDDNIEILNEKGAVRQLMLSLIEMDSKNDRLRIPELFKNEKLLENTRKEMRSVLEEMKKYHDKESTVYQACDSILERLREQSENVSGDVASASNRSPRWE